MSDKSDRLSKEEHSRIFREEVLPEAELDKYLPQEHPRAVILAGQPGAGKGSLKNAALLEFNDDIFVIDPDEQREYHTKARSWQQESPYGWSQKTNSDAGGFAGGLRDAGAERRVNLLIDTTLGDARSATRLIEGLQKAGYEVEVRAVAAHELESRVGIDRRFTDGIDRKGVGRDVPREYHDKVYRDLPGNLDVVAHSTGVRVRIYDRDDSANAVFDNRRDAGLLSDAMKETRDARIQSPVTTQNMRQEALQQADWHRDLPNNVDISPTIAEPLQREQLARDKPALSARDAEAWSTLDELVRPGAPPARTPVPEPEIPGLRRAGTLAGGTLLGTAVSAYELNDTIQRANTFHNTLGNTTAAQDALARHGAQVAGGAVGAVAGTTTAVALGLGSGGTLVLVAAEAYVLSVAADKAVTWWQEKKIYTQTDRDGVAWAFNGTQWQSQNLKGDLVVDGKNHPENQTFSALPQKARELNYLASVEAVEQALGKVPEPRNPFVQPANAGDPAHLNVKDWTYSVDSGGWSRTVADELNLKDMPQWKPDPEYASPERAAQLSAQALQTIDSNLAQGPAAIAAQYAIEHKRSGWNSFGEEPAAVSVAMNPDLLQASDGKHYQRDAQGRWAHDGEIAQGQRALELEITRDRLLPALQQHTQALAQMPAWQPPTPEQQDRENLKQLYANHGVNPKPEQFEATYAAVLRTREDNGLSSSVTSLALQRDANGQYSIDSPLQHLRRDTDGVIRVAATTTPEDIATAKRGTQMPEQNAPRVDAPSPPPSRESTAVCLDHTAHPHHAMFATLLDTVHARDRALGRTPDDASVQLAGGLTAEARARGLDTIGYAAFTPDGTKVAMTNTTDPITPWARTAVGNVGELVNQPLAQSSAQIAKLEHPLALTPTVQGQVAQQEEMAGRSARMG